MYNGAIPGSSRRRLTSLARTPVRSNVLQNSQAKSASMIRSKSRSQSDFNFSEVPNSSRKMSSFFQSSASQISTKDPRNIADPEVRGDMQRKILDFLNESEYPDALLTKLVRAPTKAEFTKVFEFILHQLSPLYGSVGNSRRIEEEFPKVMRELGYPYPLKPSTMMTIGASHAMPPLLGALCWLIEVVKMTKGLSPQELMLSGDDSDGNRASIKYFHNVKCYKKYMANKDLGHNPVNYAEEIEDLRATLEEREDLFARKEEIELRKKSLREELAELNTERILDGELDAQICRAEADNDKMREYKNQLQGKYVVLETKTKQLHAEISESEKQLDDLRNQVKMKEKQIASQKMSGEEVRQISVLKAELKSQIKELSEELVRIEKSCLAAQKESFKEGTLMRENYSKMVDTINDVLISFDAVDEDVIDIMRQHSCNEPNFEEFMNSVSERLLAFRDEVTASLKRMASEEISINQTLLKLKNEKEEIMLNIKKSNRELQKMQYEQERKREVWTEEQRKALLDLDVAKNERDGLIGCNSGAPDAMEQLAKAKMELQNRKRQIEFMKGKLVESVSERLTLIMEAWDLIKRNTDMIAADRIKLHDVYTEECGHLNSIIERSLSLR